MVRIPRFSPFSPLKPIILALAVDLLEKMLVFDPQTRINCIGSLEHKYLAEYHDIAFEPIAETFDWAFSDAVLPIGTWKVTIRNEIAGASRASLCIRLSHIVLIDSCTIRVPHHPRSSGGSHTKLRKCHRYAIDIASAHAIYVTITFNLLPKRDFDHFASCMFPLILSMVYIFCIPLAHAPAIRIGTFVHTLRTRIPPPRCHPNTILLNILLN